MAFDRYSAVPNFGVPLENPEDAQDHHALTRLLGRYGIGREDVPTDLTDITPYYWTDNPLRFFVSLAHPDGPVVLDIMPAQTNAKSIMAVAGHPGISIVGVNTIKIPDNVPAFAITGKSPRFGELTCVHELIVYRSDEVR